MTFNITKTRVRTRAKGYRIIVHNQIQILMTDEEREAAMKAIKKTFRRMRRDKKFALEVYVEMGFMTRNGNLTRSWQQIYKAYGVKPPDYRQVARQGQD